MNNLIFTSESLVSAIQTLFAQNNYKVEGPFKIHGAEVDLRAKSNSDPFAPTIYIEATIEYVNTEKYGKDATKFLLLREKEPNATLLCISSSGFSLPVKERALQSRVEPLTYDEVFARFQRFNNYIDKVLKEGDIASELAELDRVYEEARFEDALGKQSATEFLTQWQSNPSSKNPWIVIVGDYGTGKTALTKVLLRRWLVNYQEDPRLPIPFRIELRDFTRQFDARGLLHHFLDANGLGHVSVDFVFGLIKQGRIILILDGYDEMAQYMHARERRICLAALAELTKDGAKGILTSRPNYFTEAEELHLLDALYTSLADENRISKTGQNILDSEKALDSLLQTQFLDRYERFLRDLDDEQTKSLVQRVLVHDVQGQQTILGILEKTFRTSDEGASVSLSGKPVIISYLLEVVEELKSGSIAGSAITDISGLTEWQVYDLIVDKLMWRDYRRAPDILPAQRRAFLQKLSIQLSASQSGIILESDFLSLVRKEFFQKLRHIPHESREQEAQKIFADLRSSATLTRRPGTDNPGWRFSHNSLREYLASEYLVTGLKNRDEKVHRIQISDAMGLFVLSLPEAERNALLIAAAGLRSAGLPGDVIGLYASLIWEAALRTLHSERDPLATLISRLFGTPASLSNIALCRINFAKYGEKAKLPGSTFVGGSLTDIDLSGSNLKNADFSDAILEGVSFRDADLSGANFHGAMLIEVDFSRANLVGASFKHLADHSGIGTPYGSFNGNIALGYFSFHGAQTDTIPPIAKYCHHPDYLIAEKIARKLCEQPTRQKRGLTQRGPAAKDPEKARKFLQTLIIHGLVEEFGGREELVRSTDSGRPVLLSFCDGSFMDPALINFFER